MSSYFYLDSHHTQCGPISPEHFAEHGVTPQTLVWCSGMDNWTPASQVPSCKAFAFNPVPECHASASRQFANPTDTAASPDSSATGSSTYGGHSSSTYSGQQSYSGYPPMPCPKTYLVEALVVTICCCLPFGVVALVKSLQVNSFYHSGQYNAAVLASQDARKWSIIGLILGCFSLALGSGWVWLFN
ncbi:MAG: CD225/dispanin family protein [Prevotellamassilia sp.]